MSVHVAGILYDHIVETKPVLLPDSCETFTVANLISLSPHMVAITGVLLDTEYIMGKRCAE